MADVLGETIMAEWGTVEADLLFQKIKYGHPQLDKQFFFRSALAKDFVQQMLIKDPGTRITIADSLSHPFITRIPTDVNQQPKVLIVTFLMMM